MTATIMTFGPRTAARPRQPGEEVECLGEVVFLSKRDETPPEPESKRTRSAATSSAGEFVRHTPQSVCDDLRIPRLENYSLGHHYSTCPECSHKRSGANRTAEVLGISIFGWGVAVECNHCGWKAKRSLNGKGNSKDHALPTYTYTKDGVPYLRKVRNVPGRIPKCWWEQPDGKGGWISTKKAREKGLEAPSKEDKQRLYRIEEATEAAKQGHAVAVAEGEKDCDTLWTLGIPAVCSPDGASEPDKAPKWKKHHSEQLRGLDIVVLNDNDAPGYAHADATCRLSVGITKSIKRLDLKEHWPEIGEGEDVSDWLAKGGGTRERLDQLIAGAPPYKAPAVAVTGEGKALHWRGQKENGSPAEHAQRAGRHHRHRRRVLARRVPQQAAGGLPRPGAARGAAPTRRGERRHGARAARDPRRALRYGLR
jgi:hypothetical protein